MKSFGVWYYNNVNKPNTTELHTFFLNRFWLHYYSSPIFSPPYSPPPCTPLPLAFPHLSSCPWVIHVNCLASLFLILFLTSHLFCTYHLCFLFPVPFPHSSPLPLPADNPPCDLHFWDSVPVFLFA